MKFKVRKTYAATALCVVAVILALVVISGKQLFTDPVQCVVMTDAETDEVYFQQPLEADGVFSVSYIHSVNKSNVEEYYRLEDDEICLFRARYRAFGAGVATELEEGQTLSYEDGYMIIENIHYQIPNLVYRVGTVSDP
ncbi:MAG: DUF1850 domain-containing protein, partial [Peptococcaceae bacterium]|nr:DUF1850 domain-containing protein [Peptococcaceae bacterium]